MSQELMTQLNKFIAEAAKAAYAGGGGEVEPWRKGFNELEHRSGDWYYRDSYTGYFRSWGQETVWYKDKPFWTSLYGGGMTEEYQGNKEFADNTFDFLKEALSSGKKANTFQPRGPKSYKNGGWSYACRLKGGIEKFEGSESILFNGKVVFTHTFIGGLVVNA